MPRPRDIEPVVYGPLAAKQYTLFSELPSWNESSASWRRTRSPPGGWMLQLVSQRANGETLLGCPMDYPRN